MTELKEVEKEVLLSEEPSAPPNSQSSDALSSPISPGAPPQTFVPYATLAPYEPPDTASGVTMTQAELDIIKLVKKVEYELFCTRHNPVCPYPSLLPGHSAQSPAKSQAVVAEKKAGKEDRVRYELLKMPPMSRIKMRVASGVFEVSLVAVNEDRRTIEVIWDAGVKREYSWTSIIWGKTEQAVGQKPSAVALGKSFFVSWWPTTAMLLIIINYLLDPTTPTPAPAASLVPTPTPSRAPSTIPENLLLTSTTSTLNPIPGQATASAIVYEHSFPIAPVPGYAAGVASGTTPYGDSRPSASLPPSLISTAASAGDASAGSRPDPPKPKVTHWKMSDLCVYAVPEPSSEAFQAAPSTQAKRNPVLVIKPSNPNAPEAVPPAQNEASTAYETGNEDGSRNGNEHDSSSSSSSSSSGVSTPPAISIDPALLVSENKDSQEDGNVEAVTEAVVA